MKVHAEKCWSMDTVKIVYASGDVEKARDALKKHGKKNQSKLAWVLKTVKGWADTFSTRPPSKEEIRCILGGLQEITSILNVELVLLPHVGLLSPLAPFESFRIAATAGCRRRVVQTAMYRAGRPFREM